jgi:hypothetical protein
MGILLCASGVQELREEMHRLIQWTANAEAAAVKDVCVDHGCFEVFMA